MKKRTYTHLPRINQESNNNLLTQKKILSKRFKTKLLKNATSYLLSSIVAISILCIAKKSVAQTDERPGFIAVMRLNKNHDFLLIRRNPTIVEKVKETVQFFNTKVEPDLLENVVLRLEYLSRADNNLYPKDLYPTTIVELDQCGPNGWCQLKKIIYYEGELKKEDGGAWYKNILTNQSLENSLYQELKNSRYQAWVPSSNFCDMDSSALPLIPCSSQTTEMVRKNPSVQEFQTQNPRVR